MSSQWMWKNPGEYDILEEKWRECVKEGGVMDYCVKSCWEFKLGRVHSFALVSIIGLIKGKVGVVLKDQHKGNGKDKSHSVL